VVGLMGGTGRAEAATRRARHGRSAALRRAETPGAGGRRAPAPRWTLLALLAALGESARMAAEGAQAAGRGSGGSGSDPSGRQGKRAREISGARVK
jgi:hypothetical protein